jgi:hypothetical protein
VTWYGWVLPRAGEGWVRICGGASLEACHRRLLEEAHRRGLDRAARVMTTGRDPSAIPAGHNPPRVRV